jgi:molybdopterin-guanine dinucleotide biosynthesis protein A
MIAALICGSRDREDFPGRNTFPLLGRPMMEYALLAAQHAAAVDQVHLSSDDPAILRIGERLGSRLIVRPAELAGPDTPMAAVLTQAAARIREGGERLEALVLLLCNAPTVTPELIDHAVAMLRAQPRAAAVVSVTARREYSPRNALRIRAGGELEAYWPQRQPVSEGEVFFPDGLLWVLRPDCWAPVDAHLPPSWIVDPAAHPTLPLVHEGYGDVDYIWQVPAIEDWLRRKQFTSHSLPYRTGAPARAAAPAATPRLRRGAGHRPRVLITTVPFGEPDRYPLDLLERGSHCRHGGD